MKLSVESYVRLRARHRCEYCKYPESEANLPFALDHVIARKHAGPTTIENLALSCPFCNAHKGADLTGRDPNDGAIVPLFNPRVDSWHAHFKWDGARVVPLTAKGRVTEYVLALNHPQQLARRRDLLLSGWLLQVDL